MSNEKSSFQVLGQVLISQLPKYTGIQDFRRQEVPSTDLIRFQYLNKKWYLKIRAPGGKGCYRKPLVRIANQVHFGLISARSPDIVGLAGLYRMTETTNQVVCFRLTYLGTLSDKEYNLREIGK